MDKNAIKRYAVWARRELIARVSQKAAFYGITEEDHGDPNADSVNGKVLGSVEKKERKALIELIEDKGYQEVMEEVAYTWFNRFSALRFMEVNGYLPTHVRVFTDEENNFKPQILAEAIHMEMYGLDIDKVYGYKEADQNEELYKYLLITQCNALNSILPGMFQKISDFTELLFPDNLLREGSVIEQMINSIPEEDWKDAVQIIGWLYQYYISEPKDTLINTKKQYKTKDVPFVTQIFTSDWIVKYMVQNSLGRAWVDDTGSDYKNYGWEYYLDSFEKQTYDRKLKPEEIKVIDPCMGSGHILVYVFDVLMQIYEDYGYSQTDAAELILMKNLYGLDISDRAYQLSYFSIMMKARKYNRRILNKKIKPNLFSLQNIEIMDDFIIDFICADDKELRSTVDACNKLSVQINELGSLVIPEKHNYVRLLERLTRINDECYDNLISISYQDKCQTQIYPLVAGIELLNQKYNFVITNPPYIGSKYLPGKLKKYIDNYYKDYKNDIFAAFISRIIPLCKENGHMAFLTPYVWMFINAYKELRSLMLQETKITSLVQLEYNAFESACVPVCGFTLKKTEEKLKGEYVKLSEFKGIDIQATKVKEAIINRECGFRFSTNQDKFNTIPGQPIAYWVSEKFANCFKNENIDNFTTVTNGMFTCDNNRFLRMWYEINMQNFYVACNSKKDSLESNKKWYPYNKGGNYRKWYGNHEYVINFLHFGDEISKFRQESGQSASFPGQNYYFNKSLSWSFISSSKFGVRYYPKGFVFDIAGSSIFVNKESDLYSILGFLGSSVAVNILQILNPTMNYQAGNIKQLPIKNEVLDNEILSELAKNNISLSKEDWDSKETSWNYVKSPLICNGVNLISKAFSEWKNQCNQRFNQLKQNEREINDVVINIYDLGDDISGEVLDTEITIELADKERNIKELISYAVGCMFGRYSLELDGLVYAGGKWDSSKYCSFKADEDNIIPICDDEYFSDDITGRFFKFIEVVYGKDTLEENLQFIADALGGRGQAREVIRNYFMNDFFKDHCKIYQKRPIYWLFDSGKKNGFKALIYMHRYQPDTIARIRTDYVHEQQSRYNTAIADIEKQLVNAETSERVKLNKQLKKLTDQANEIHEYEEKIHHLADQMILIDLDDGVKVNYAKFQDVLAKIK